MNHESRFAPAARFFAKIKLEVLPPVRYYRPVMKDNPASIASDALCVTADKATCGQIEHFLQCRSNCFSPPFASRVDVAAYAMKIRRYAHTYELWNAGTLDALMAVYANPDMEQVYVTYLCAAGAESATRSIGSLLLNRAKAYPLPYRYVRLEVSKSNVRALRFYRKHMFEVEEDRGEKYLMVLSINQDNVVGG